VISLQPRVAEGQMSAGPSYVCCVFAGNKLPAVPRSNKRPRSNNAAVAAPLHATGVSHELLECIALSWRSICCACRTAHKYTHKPQHLLPYRQLFSTPPNPAGSQLSWQRRLVEYFASSQTLGSPPKCRGVHLPPPPPSPLPPCVVLCICRDPRCCAHSTNSPQATVHLVYH